MEQKQTSAYKESGVDIVEAAQLVERIKPHIAKTKRSGVVSNIGGFGALFDLKQTGYKDPIMVSATDGVGTKIKIAIDTNRHETIGIDAVAMCVNDLVVQGAEPLFFLDYFATGKLENDVAEKVIKGIAKGCEESGCALIGGETAEMPGLYAAGDYDIAGFTVGAVERENLITGENINAGDTVLGLASNGLHSNGFSLVRRIVEKSAQGYEGSFDFATGETIADHLLTPTRLYVKPILNILKALPDSIKGMAHITGGGFHENIPRILPDGLGAKINCANWSLPPVFKWLKEHGNLSIDDMASTLNCGIGMIVICAAEDAESLQEKFEEEGESVYNLGTIIDSSAQEITLLNADSAWGN